MVLVSAERTLPHRINLRGDYCIVSVCIDVKYFQMDFAAILPDAVGQCGDGNSAAYNGGDSRDCIHAVPIMT